MTTIPDKTPILYTQDGCADSARVRAWLDQQQIPYIERNVMDDFAAARELMSTGTFATPLLVVGDHQVVGFRPAKLVAALGIEPT